MNNLGSFLAYLMGYVVEYFRLCEREKVPLPDEATFRVREEELVISLYRKGSVIPLWRTVVVLGERR